MRVLKLQLKTACALCGTPICSLQRGALTLVAAITVVSCGAFDAYHQAKTGAAAALSCPESELRQASTTRASAYHYRFEGCGRSVSMSCASSVSSGQVICSPESYTPQGGQPRSGGAVPPSR